MNPLVVITHPRRIPECVASYAALGCDVAYLSGLSLVDACPVMAGLVDSTDYSHYLVCADDCVVSQGAVDAVADLLERGHPVATGWCGLDRDHPMANLTVCPLAGDVPCEDAYAFASRVWVAGYPAAAVPTGFVGMALTGMSRDMWQRFPLACFDDGDGHGWSSDFHLSMRLRDADVPMVAARDGYVEHVKEVWQRADEAPEKRLLIGEIPQEVIWQCV